MDTRFSDEDLAFRDEVRAFFKEEYTQELQDRMKDKTTFKAAVIEWQKKLHAKGWIAPGWPVQYGGTGWTPTQGSSLTRPAQSGHNRWSSRANRRACADNLRRLGRPYPNLQ